MNNLRQPCEHGRYDAHYEPSTPAQPDWMTIKTPCLGGTSPTDEELIAIVDAMDGVCVFVRGQMGYDTDRYELVEDDRLQWL